MPVRREAKTFVQPAIRRVCVFCGSKSGRKKVYAQAARKLGEELAERNIGLVFGGGRVGLMGIVANAVLERGGEVLGVIPGGLASREVAHTDVSHLYVVATMHERKAKMEQLSDGFIALPGGFGTFEELFEIVTWLQLGLHRKPAGLLNVGGYYDPLLQQIEKGLAEGFIPEQLESAVVADERPDRLVERLLRHEVPPPAVKWITREET